MKKIILKIVLPLLILASLSFSVWTLIGNYYQNQLTDYYKTDKKIVTKNTKKFTDYALSEGKITIDNATVQANLNNKNQYNIRGFSNGQAVSVNVNKNPKIVNHQIILHKLTPNATIYWSSEKDVRHKAYVLAENNQNRNSSEKYSVNMFSLLILQLAVILGTLIGLIGWLVFIV